MIRKPEVTLQIIRASQLTGVQDQKALIIGQMLAAGTATAGAVIEVGNDGAENALFGRTSHVAGMVRQFKEYNQLSGCYVLPLADAGAAVKGTAVITIAAGPATADGTLTFNIGSINQHRYVVDVLSGDTVTEIGDALAALIAADLDAPFTAANAIGVVTVTAENGGTLCNDWIVAVEGTATAVTVALTGWAAGATDPVLTGILDAMGTVRYQTIVWPAAYATTEVESQLNARFNSANDVLDGIGIQVKPETLANLKSYANQNSQSMVIFGIKAITTATRPGNQQREFPDILAARIGAIRALRLTEDAPISQFVTTPASADQFGGVALASLPYFNTPLPENVAPLPEDEFTPEELDELRDAGVATLGANPNFTSTILGEVVTTYLTDAAANADDSYKYLNTVDTASVIREFYAANFRSRYAQTRLTDGDLLSGRDMANAASIQAFCNRLYDELAEDTLVQFGSAARKDFNDNLLVVTDVRNGKATVTMAPLLVSQLRTILGTIQINFGG